MSRPPIARAAADVAEHGRPFAAVAARDNVFATQFHPEKSGPTGLQLLANYVGVCAAARAGSGASA